MKNLAVEQYASGEIPGLEPSQRVQACCISGAGAETLLFLTTGSPLSLICSRLAPTPTLQWDVPLPYDGAHAVGLGVVLELDGVCLALSTGQILLIGTEREHPVPEDVGCVEDGLAAMEWSPEGEVAALVSCTGQLLLMDQGWDVLAEVAMYAGNAGGWDLCGSGDVHISWRGDSKYFATACRPHLDGAPIIQIWDREGCQLHSTAESAPHLQPVIAWQPNGRHLYAAAAAAAPPVGSFTFPAEPPIAGSTQAIVPSSAGTAGAAPAAPKSAVAAAVAASAVGADAGCSRVLLFERNGLAHGGFPLQSPGRSIMSLTWSLDSELLAIVTAPADTGLVSEEETWSVQVWHRSNWHWYLKHQRVYHYPSHGALSAGSDDSQPHHVTVLWDQAHAGRMHIVSRCSAVPRHHASGYGGQVYRRSGYTYEVVQLLWTGSVSPMGTAALADGRELLITPLRHTVVPPPMCAVRATFPEAVMAAAFVSCKSHPDSGVSIPIAGGNRSPGVAGDKSTGHSVTAADGRSIGGVGGSSMGGRSGGGGGGAGEADSAGGSGGYDEAVAVLGCSSAVHFLRSVEEDLWEETLEVIQEQLMPAAPTSNITTTALLPLPQLQPSTAGYRPSFSVSGGRPVNTICWGGEDNLLAVAARYQDNKRNPPAEPGSAAAKFDLEHEETGIGSVLIGLSVKWRWSRHHSHHSHQQHAASDGNTSAHEGTASGAAAEAAKLAPATSAPPGVSHGLSNVLAQAVEGLNENNKAAGEGGGGAQSSSSSSSRRASGAGGHQDGSGGGRAAGSGAQSGGGGGGSAGVGEAICVGVSVHRESLTYAGGNVLAIAPHAGGGVVLQLSTGEIHRWQAALPSPPTSASGATRHYHGSTPPDAAPASLTPAAPSSNFPSPCPWMWGTPQGVEAADAHQGEVPPAVGLTASGMLYWGAALVASEVTSAAVRHGGAGGPALLYTTRSSLMYTVFFAQLVAGHRHRELLAQGSERRHLPSGGYKGGAVTLMHLAMKPLAHTAAARDVLVRAVEQGSHLVSVPEGGVSAVLQMPRGNLEVVCPRPLVLAAIAEALQRRQYGEAWRLACTNRVDLNLLVDYGWPTLLSHASDFVKAVPDPRDLCDLMYALKPDSVLREGGLYATIPLLLQPDRVPAATDAVQPADGGVAQPAGQQGLGGPAAAPGPMAVAVTGSAAVTGPGTAAAKPGTIVGGGVTTERPDHGQSAAAAPTVAGKISGVCSAIREAMLQLHGTGPGIARYLPVVVTSYTRSDPPQLEAALRCIKDSQEKGLQADSSNSTTSTTSQAAHSNASDRPDGTPHARSHSSSTSERDVLPAGVVAAAFSNEENSGSGGGSSSRSAGTPSSSSSAAEKALKHLLLSVDADELYRTALGMYELPLAYMVIAHAQKDPGEYLLELQQFAAVNPVALRRHNIDVLLRRYSSALNHLLEAGPQHFDAALSLGRQHGLMRQLLQSVQAQSSPHSARLPVVLDAYGEVLEAAAKYEDAGMAFVAAGQLEKALRAYRSGGLWRLVFIVAARLRYAPQAISKLAAQVSEELLALGQPAAAAAVLILYLGDVDNGVVTLTRAREWRESVRVSYQHNRADLVDRIVAPAAAEAAASMLEEAREAVARLTKYSARLTEVREKKAAMQAAVEAQDDDMGYGFADDTISEAGSMVSGLSMYTDNTHTGATTVNGSSAGGGGSSRGGHGSSRAASTVGGRRPMAPRDLKKAAKKAGKIRAGAPNEEASLIAHLRGMAPPDHTLQEAGQLCELLILLGHASDARLLQRALADWVRQHQVVLQELPPPDSTAQQPGSQRAPAVAPTAAPALQWKWDILREA